MSESPNIPDIEEEDEDEPDRELNPFNDEDEPEENDETLTNSVKDSEEEKTKTEEEELEENLAELDEETANLFDGVEEGDNDSTDPTSEDSEPVESVEDSAEPMGKFFANGMATTMTLGLQKDEREEYRPQFKEIFEEFQVDYYAGEVIQEKLLQEDEELDPTMALVGATAIACITCFSMRPDSDKKLNQLRNKLQGD